MWPEGQLWKPGPSYPATVAALPPAPLFRIRIFCSRGSLTPVAAPNASPNVFLAWGRMRITGFVLADEDVSAPGPVVETGAGVTGQREVYFPTSRRGRGAYFAKIPRLSHCAPLGLSRRVARGRAGGGPSSADQALPLTR